MRTTLSLDDDVSRELERAQRERKTSFKRLVNEVLRAGLLQLARGPAPRKGSYRTEGVSLGKPRLASLDDVAEVLAIGEGEDHS